VPSRISINQNKRVSKRENEHLIKLSDQLYQASKSVRILRNVNWPSEVRDAFFASGESKLPVVSYPVIDPSETLEEVDKARKLIPTSSRFTNWANGIADKLENSAHLLSNLGKPAFYDYSAKLYGAPNHLLPDGKSNSMDLANHFEVMYSNIDKLDINITGRTDVPATEVQSRMKEEVDQMFGTDAPEVIIDKEVSSKAIAGRRRIRIRESALFTDMDIDQLIHHEAFIHVATSINGHHQPKMKILKRGWPCLRSLLLGILISIDCVDCLTGSSPYRWLSMELTLFRYTDITKRGPHARRRLLKMQDGSSEAG